ncbi:sn-1,2-diacylglycerol ethanolamine-and cholinephosphotranferases [Ceraceosorus bombacis]|uniref:sn-1,2-diacylglycerol ethanolamine-and cholinephosphotranferases n=1 Tax=Ceraceosorus bombacis TaxID=401625 RepID=A0A0P1BP01_9BASI|nr:sn-1,2-diacylglycerol ethanolamine-and cholinephosphotranferases [Ceraceosorus bombacis]
MGHYIPKRRLPALHAYKYSGQDDSWISANLLSPWWNWLVQQFPLWVAPNTITLSGLALVGINFASLLIIDGGMDCGTSASLDPRRRTENLNASGDKWASVSLFEHWGFPESMKEHTFSQVRCIPPWVFLSWSIGLFLYQSLDAIDGKQARRTGMAGPLGEMFDHGCDAINTTLESLLCCAALNVGRSYWALASVVATLSNFYLTTWEEYHTGTLYLSAFSGPVEGILMICVIYLITAIVPGGANFWNRGIFSLSGIESLDVPALAHLAAWNIKANEAFLSFGATALGFNILASYGNVRKARAAKGLSTVTPLTGLLPLLAQNVVMVAWALGNHGQLLKDGSVFVPFISTWGLGFAYSVGLLIVAHVTKAPFPYWNIATLFGLVGAVDAWLPTPILQSSPQRVQVTVFSSLVLAAAFYLHFCYDVITTITVETGKPCFQVVPPEQQKPKNEGKELSKKQ